MGWFRAALGGAAAAVAVAAAAFWLLDGGAPVSEAPPQAAVPAPAEASPVRSDAAAPAPGAASEPAPQPEAAPDATRDEAAEAAGSPAAPKPALAVATAPTAGDAPPPGPLPGPERAPASPRFDVVRVEPDGSAVFAGVAEPDARIEVRIGDRVVATAQAGRDGGFVAFGDTRADDAAQGSALDVQRIDLAAIGPGGDVGVGAAPVFVAPPTSDDPDAAAPLVIRANDGGVEIVQRPGAAPPPGGVTLETVSYGDDGVVEVGGRAEGLRRLRIWADALLIAETVAEPDGRWMARAERGLAPGRYTLRVEAVADDGSVLAVAATPFRRENAVGAPEPGQIVVQPGDSLWRIAANTYGRGVRYTVIYEANADRIRNPDLIYPGQVFTLPPPAR